jgi:NosR/NirI family transcriptional regulator, nitrous oxide reductase regulator
MLERLAWLWTAALAPASASATENFPPPEFTSGYQYPSLFNPAPRPEALAWVDMGVLALALGGSAYLALRGRSRRGQLLLTLFSIGYFGFYRHGCVCSVGSFQNVAQAVAESGVTLPLVVAVFFVLPLLAALFVGRAFCGSVCPLGALQEVVLLKPVRVPPWLDATLSVFPGVYLGFGVLYAATGTEYLVCREDPFIGFYRLGGETPYVACGVVLLALSVFVGRPYCRYLCPYSVLLRWASVFARWKVSITPAGCINCHLCAQACPYGAIRPPTPELAGLPRSHGKRTLAGMLLLTPVLMLLGGWLLSLGSPVLARVHPKVKLAERVWLESQGRVEGATLESDAFRAHGTEPGALYATATALEGKFHRGAWWLGAWVGLLLGGRLIALTVRRRRSDYQVDPSACVACGRCFASCPVTRSGAAALSPAQSRAGDDSVPEETS